LTLIRLEELRADSSPPGSSDQDLGEQTAQACVIACLEERPILRPS